MAKPDLVPLYVEPQGEVFSQRAVGFSPVKMFSSTRRQILKRQVLKRSGGLFLADTPLNLTNPGLGWDLFGNIIGAANELDLLINIKLYRNGQLLTAREKFNPDFDFYFVEKNTVAFVFSIRTSEILQISKNFEET